MGISVKLYPVNGQVTEENFDAVANEIELNKEKEVDLYKITPDLYMLLANSPEPFEDSDSIEFHTIMGRIGLNSKDNFEDKYGYSLLSMLSTEGIKGVFDWIKSKRIDSESGFYSHFDKLNDEVKEMIDGFGSSAEELYSYFKELSALYKFSAENNCAIVFTLQ
jgi:hypothetical protein